MTMYSITKHWNFFHSIFFVRGQTVIYRWGSLAGVRCAIRRALSSHSAERNWETSEGSSYVFSLLILEPFFLPLMVKVDAKFMVFIWVLFWKSILITLLIALGGPLEIQLLFHRRFLSTTLHMWFKFINCFTSKWVKWLNSYCKWHFMRIAELAEYLYSRFNKSKEW